MKKDNSNDTVSFHMELAKKDNLELQELASSENISKKAMAQNIIAAYLAERKVSELLPSFIEDVNRWSAFLDDLKALAISNAKLLKQNNDLLQAMAGIDQKLDTEAAKFLSNESADDQK